MVTGYLLLCLVILVVGNALGQRIKQEKVQKFLHKMHKPLGIATIIIGILHLVLTLPVWKMRADVVVVTGILTLGLCIVEFLIYRKRKDWKKAWLRYHRIGAIVLIIALVSHMVTYFVDFNQYHEKMVAIHVDGMSAAGIANGTYQGQYDAGYIKVVVEVKVKNESIVSIQLLEHDNERGKKAEVLVDEVMKEQTTNVDAVSGATNSSQVILKAIEDALRTAQKK